MIKIYQIFLCSLMLAPGLMAQKMAKVTPDLLQRSQHPSFPEAPAVYLINHGQMNVNLYSDGSAFVEVNYRQRIQIYNIDGAGYAQVFLELYNNRSGAERIRNIKVTSYNLRKDKVQSTEMDRRMIKYKEINDNITLVSFRAPKVKDQTIIDISYTVSTPFLGAAPRWYFQKDIPVEVSLFQFYNYYDFPFIPHFSGTDRVKLQLEGRKSSGAIQRDLTALAQNVPPVVIMDHLLSPEDGVSSVKMAAEPDYFRTSLLENRKASWEEAGKELLAAGFFGKMIEREFDELNPIIRKAKNQTEDEAIATVYQEIQRRYKWNRQYDIGPQKDLNDILESKQGSIGEINLLLLNVLDKLNIEADPILTKNRGDGILQSSTASLADFNYLLVRITKKDGSQLLIDASSKLVPLGEIPYRATNATGLLVLPVQSKMILLPNPNLYKVNSLSKLQIDAPNQMLKGEGKRQYTQYATTSHKVRIANKMADEDVRFETQLEPELWSARDKYTITNVVEKENNELVFDFTQEIKDALRQNGDTLLIGAALNFGVKTNPFSQEMRSLPVFLSSKIAFNYVATIEIDDSFEIIEYPSSASWVLPDDAARFAYEVKPIQNGLSIAYNLVINKTVFDTSEYANLRQFYELILSKEMENIKLLRL